ncbi:hypothetical protein BT67DRAFT_274080 [Trichocladium antarcticum]|uniref:Transmembrane protein n=1 Tax=Trichocladium antarcticum TaxID=1450529 RepID=A0AAN6UP93_9PEZI|nr:hypothetical protein BT67DRAFT_274080 [Trichocladium antarcticum]
MSSCGLAPNQGLVNPMSRLNNRPNLLVSCRPGSAVPSSLAARYIHTYIPSIHPSILDCADRDCDDKRCRWLTAKGESRLPHLSFFMSLLGLLGDLEPSSSFFLSFFFLLFFSPSWQARVELVGICLCALLVGVGGVCCAFVFFLLFTGRGWVLILLWFSFRFRFS